MRKSTIIEIKPCPCCGGDANIGARGSMTMAEFGAEIICMACGLNIFAEPEHVQDCVKYEILPMHSAINNAISKWNKRMDGEV